MKKLLLISSLLSSTSLLAQEDPTGFILGLGIGSTTTATTTEAEAESLFFDYKETQESAGTTEIYIGYQISKNLRVGITGGAVNTIEYPEGEYEIGYGFWSLDYIHYLANNEFFIFGGLALGQSTMKFSYENKINIDEEAVAFGGRIGFGYKFSNNSEIGLKYQTLVTDLEGEDTYNNTVFKVGYKDFETTALFFNYKF